MTAVTASLVRIGAMIRRYLYLMRSSWPRLIDLAYWPTVQMIMWGLITQFFTQHSSWVAQATGVLLSAVLLWDILFRAQLGVSTSFMEELYARNLAQLFASPLRPWELATALTAMSVVRATLGVGAAALLAIPLYHYNIFAMGLPLLGFYSCLLVFGWAIGLAMCGALLRWGLGVEGLAWASIFALAPVSGIYYPIATLPDWLEPLAWSLPSSHVFEGMRTVLIEGRFDAGMWWRGALLALAWLGGGVAIFTWSFRIARVRGLLLRVGE